MKNIKKNTIIMLLSFVTCLINAADDNTYYVSHQCSMFVDDESSQTISNHDHSENNSSHDLGAGDICISDHASDIQPHDYFTQYDDYFNQYHDQRSEEPSPSLSLVEKERLDYVRNEMNNQSIEKRNAFFQSYTTQIINPATSAKDKLELLSTNFTFRVFSDRLYTAFYKLQQRIANILCNKDGSLKTLTTFGQNKLAYVINDFMKNHLFKDDTAGYGRWSASMIEQKIPGFDFVINNQSKDMDYISIYVQKALCHSKYDLGKDLRDRFIPKKTILSNNFNKDVLKYETALKQRDYATIKTIEEKYKKNTFDKEKLAVLKHTKTVIKGKWDAEKPYQLAQQSPTESFIEHLNIDKINIELKKICNQDELKNIKQFENRQRSLISELTHARKQAYAAYNTELALNLYHAMKTGILSPLDRQTTQEIYASGLALSKIQTNDMPIAALKKFCFSLLTHFPYLDVNEIFDQANLILKSHDSWDNVKHTAKLLKLVRAILTTNLNTGNYYYQKMIRSYQDTSHIFKKIQQEELILTDHITPNKFDNIFAEKIADYLSLKIILEHPTVQDQIATVNPLLTYQPDTTLLDQAPSAEQTEEMADLDWRRTGNEYSVAEYIKQTDALLTDMQEGPAQLAAQQARDVIAAQWDDLKNETKLLLQQTGDVGVETLDQFCWIFDEGLYRALSVGPNVATPSDQTITEQMINAVTTSIHNVAQGVEAAAHLLAINANSISESLNFQMQAEDQAIYDNFIAQGKHHEATTFRMEKEMHHHMQENPRIKMIREKIVHNCKHPIQFIGKTVRGTLGTANIIKNAAFQTITYDLSLPAEQQAMQNQLQNQYDNLIQTVKEITPGQLDTFVSDVIADMATLKIFNVIAQSGKDIASQASSSRNAPGTAITPRPDQLPAVSRCAKKETPIITSKHLAAQRLLQDQQRAPQASTSHANSSGPQAGTSANKQVDKGKYPADRPAAAVEDQSKFKGATEEPAQRTGRVEKQPNTSGSSSNTKPDSVQKFEQKYAKYRTRYETVAETGEKARIPYPKDWQKWDEWAEDAYDAIRARSDDIIKIAKNTKMSETKIRRIKDHLFYDKTHILPREGRTGKFSPDHEIAAAWERLNTGDFIENDIRLLEHEYFESRFEKIFKTDYDTAHLKAFKAQRPWDYPKYKE